MKKVVIIIFLIFSTCSAILSQQDTHYTGYMFNSLIINPAYAGSRDATSITAYYRHQWADIKSAPRDFSISGHSPLKKNVGLGAYIESDWIGVHNRLSLFGSYSYKIRLNNNAQISAGLQAGFLRYSSNFSEITETLEDPTDFVYNEDQARLLPNFGFGLFYYTSKGYIGFSIPHLLNNKIIKEDGTNVDLSSTQKQHMFLSGGTVVQVNDYWKIRPTAILKKAPKSPVSFDLSLAFIFDNRILGGIAHRFTDSISLFGEYQVNNNIRIGYAYDYPIQPISNFAGSHELFVGYDIPTNDQTKIVTPRFF